MKGYLLLLFLVVCTSANENRNRDRTARIHAIQSRMNAHTKNMCIKSTITVLENLSKIMFDLITNNTVKTSNYTNFSCVGRPNTNNDNVNKLVNVINIIGQQVNDIQAYVKIIGLNSFGVCPE